MAFQLAPFLAQSVPGVGLLGAIVGGSAALAKNYKDYKKGSVDAKAASVDVGKETAGAGVATAVSAAAVGAVGGGLAVSLVTALAVATGAKYVWDRSMEQVDAYAARQHKEDPFEEALKVD